MNIDDLIEASKNYDPTEADCIALEKRLIQAELKFEREAREKQITQEWLTKEYTL